jgi:hypothetical protein
MHTGACVCQFVWVPIIWALVSRVMGGSAFIYGGLWGSLVIWALIIRVVGGSMPVFICKGGEDLQNSMVKLVKN